MTLNKQKNKKKTTKKTNKDVKKSDKPLKTSPPEEFGETEIVKNIKKYEADLIHLTKLGRKTKIERKIMVLYGGGKKFFAFTVSGLKVFLLGEIDYVKKSFKFDRSFPAHLLPNGKEHISLK